MSWLALPLVLLLPGCITLAAWRGRKAIDFWEGLFLAPFISILLSSWVGFLLAEAGVFSLTALSSILFVYCLTLALLARRSLCLAPFAAPSAGAASLLLLAVLAVAGWAFARPAEVISGTFDPGIYLSTGANIARTGSIAYSDPFLAGLGDDLRAFLLEPRGEIGVGAVRLPAFWMPRAQGDTVVPAFFHLYPVWLAILYSVGGTHAALFVSPIFGLMGVWALYLLGRRLGGPGVGLLAAALLAVNPAQVWFARYPISEVTVQMFLLGGLTLWVLMEERRSRLLALTAGTAFGLAHLAKVDQLLLPGALFLTLFLLWFFRNTNCRDAPQGRLQPASGEAPLAPTQDAARDASPGRLYKFFLVPYGLLLVHSILHVYFFAFAYTWINLGPFLPAITSPLALGLYLCGGLALLAAAVNRGRAEALRLWFAAHRTALSLALAGVVGAAALYTYFLWPLNPSPGQSAFLSSDGVTPVYLNLFREEGLVRLGWYLSPLGLLLGLVGFVLFVKARAGRRTWPLLLFFAAHLVLYILTAGLAYPVHFWAIRRYVQLVIPAFLLFASFAVFSLCRDGWVTRLYGSTTWRRGLPARGDGSPTRLYNWAARLLTAGWVTRPATLGDGSPTRLYGWAAPVHMGGWVTRLLPAALCLALLVPSLQTSARFLWQTEYEGALRGLGRLAGRMDDPAVVLFKPRLEGNIISAPLQYLFGKTAFVLQREPEEPLYTQGMERWLAEGWGVYLVLEDRYPRYLAANRYELVDDAGLVITAMEQSLDRLPEVALPMSFPLRLFRVSPAAGYPYRLEMGPLWTESVLRFKLPRTSAPALRLSFRAWSGGAATLAAYISLDGLPHQTVAIAPDPRSYQVTWPVDGPEGEGYHEVVLAVDPVSSAERGGIVLEWVEVAEAPVP